MRIPSGSFNSYTDSVSQPNPPQQASKPAPVNTGVGSTTDEFEAANRSTSGDYDKTPTLDFLPKQIDAEPTVDPSEMFQHFGVSDSSTAAATGTPDLNSILNNPGLPFEEKMALFLFDFLEKAEKDLLAKMEQLDKSRQNGTTLNASQGTAGQGGVNGSQGPENAGNGNAQNSESEQIGLEKLKLAHEKMTKMFSTVDNILTSLTRTVKEGPIAALKG
jgi:hypothetical protein